jgi:hypothetical protein
MLAPSRVQLHLADLQDSILALSRTMPGADLRRAAGVLTKVAPLLGIPVTLSAAPPPGGLAMIDEVASAGPTFLRSGPCVWDDDAAREAITAHDRKVIGLCGVASEVVVLHTALAALGAGHEVYVLLDATGGLSERTENAALGQITAAGGRLTCVASFITDMVRDFTTPSAREVIAAMQGLMGASRAT